MTVVVTLAGFFLFFSLFTYYLAVLIMFINREYKTKAELLRDLIPFGRVVRGLSTRWRDLK